MKSGKHTKKLRVPQGKKVNLKAWETCIKPLYEDTADYQARLEKFKDDLSVFQEKLYASSNHAILIIFQGMDTSGKDGAIAHVMSGVNPQGCRVQSFKTPSEDELKHDFLWRTHLQVPGKGEIGIFNRSYYEEVLVDRVHPKLLDQERLPEYSRKVAKFWTHRLHDIRDHERYLDRQGIKIVKFFLHISKEEQRQRLLARLDNPKKHWKISIHDFEERKYWKDYQRAYEHCFSETSTEECPWFIIPADDKKNARILISHILLDELRCIPVNYPKPTGEQLKALKQMRKML